MISVRIDESTLAAVDRERRRVGGLPRARVITEGLHLWVERARTREAVRLHREGYAHAPVAKDEFTPVLGASRWPR